MSRMYPRIFWKNRAFDDVIKQVGFEGDEQDPSGRKAYLTPGLGGPAGGRSFLGSAEAIGLQQDTRQFAVWVSEGCGVVAKVSNGVHQRRWQLGHGPVELCEGPRDEVCGKSRVVVPEPCLW
jgi:hypothetical protein